MISAETIEVMSDEDNSKVRRTLKLSALLRLWERGKLDDDRYRIGDRLQVDILTAHGGASGANWRRLPGGGYISLPRSTGPALAPQERAPDAVRRIGEARAAVTDRLPWLVLYDMLESDRGPVELERRWRMPRKHGGAVETIVMALGRIADAKVYEQVKWQATIWGMGA